MYVDFYLVNNTDTISIRLCNQDYVSLGISGDPLQISEAGKSQICLGSKDKSVIAAVCWLVGFDK